MRTNEQITPVEYIRQQREEGKINELARFAAWWMDQGFLACEVEKEVIRYLLITAKKQNKLKQY